MKRKHHRNPAERTPVVEEVKAPTPAVSTYQMVWNVGKDEVDLKVEDFCAEAENFLVQISETVDLTEVTPKSKYHAFGAVVSGQYPRIYDFINFFREKSFCSLDLLLKIS